MTAPQRIQPQATPFSTDVSSHQIGGKGCVVVDFSLLTGTVKLFYPPDVAEQIGQQMIQAAQVARTGLLLAPAGFVPQRLPDVKP